MISDFNRVENIMGKGENAGYQHFLLFAQCFQKLSFPGSLAEPHSSVGIVADLRKEGRCFDHRLGQYSFRGLVIVIVTGFIPLSRCCPLFQQWLCGKAASALERILC